MEDEVKQIPQDKFEAVINALGDTFGDEVEVEETQEELEVAEEEVVEEAAEETVGETQEEVEAVEEEEEYTLEVSTNDGASDGVDEGVSDGAKEEQKPVQGKYKFKNDLAASVNKLIEETDGTPAEMAAEIARFAQAWSADYSGLDAKALIRAELFSDPDNAELSQKTFDRLYQRELEKYNLDSDDPDEVIEGRELLERDAKAIRRTLSQQAQDFVSKYKTNVEVDVEAEKQGPTPEEIAAQREANVRNVSKEFGKYLKDGKFTLKDKDGEINIPVEKVDSLSEMIVDPSGFLAKTLMKDGKFDTTLAIKIAAFASNPSVYDSTLIKHGIAKGKLSGLAVAKNSRPMANARPTKGSGGLTPDQDPEGFKAAMAEALGRSRR